MGALLGSHLQVFDVTVTAVAREAADDANAGGLPGP